MRGWKAAGCALALILALPVCARAAEPFLTARAVIAIDGRSGEVLYERDAEEPLPPASTTKVMTAILALESGRLEDEFVVSEWAADTPPSKIHLRPGQRMRLHDLLYAVLLNSANDAAVVVAEGVAGSEGAFAARMNAKAQMIGARSAHFENPHGLSAPGHVASARDLALIFRYGLRMPLFREILGTRSIAVPVESEGVHMVALHSHNRLLATYPIPVIGKTGYTRPARRCFVGAASLDGRDVIIALLGASDLWGDARRLLGHVGVGPEEPPVVMADVVPIPHLGRRAKRHPKRSHHPKLHRPHHAARGAAAFGDDEGSGSRFAVQVGPYRNRGTAAAARARLAGRGYGAVQAGSVLRLGAFSNRARAATLASRLRVSGYPSKIVVLN
jgi:hypothetical protein